MNELSAILHPDTSKPSGAKVAMAAALALLTCYITASVLETFAVIILALSPQDSASSANLIAYEVIKFSFIGYLGYRVFFWSLRRK